MSEFSKETIDKYKQQASNPAGGAPNCPYPDCGADIDPDGRDFGVESTPTIHATMVFDCSECGRSWWEEYRLINIRPFRDKDYEDFPIPEED
jgi:hypothetical protein